MRVKKHINKEDIKLLKVKLELPNFTEYVEQEDNNNEMIDDILYSSAVEG